VIDITVTFSEVVHHLSGSIFLERCSVEDPLKPVADIPCLGNWSNKVTFD
jgi:hypothetical protein